MNATPSARKRRKKKARNVAKTMDDVARLAGVSKPTVSRALNDSPLVTPETKARVLEVAQQCGYAVNKNAQKLRGRRTNTIAVAADFQALPGLRISDPFHFEILADVARALAVRNQDLLLCSPATSDNSAFETLLTSRGADGIIFLGQGARGAIFTQLAEAKAPFVVWGAPAHGPLYCTVGSDNKLGGALAGRRFAKLRRKRVLFVGLGREHPEMDFRRQGLELGLAEAASTAQIDDLIIDDLAFATSLTAINAYLESADTPPDAIFAASDTIAMAATKAIAAKGMRIPDDITVIGYDDNPQAAHWTPPLTTVHQDTRQAGALLVEKLMQMLEGVQPKSSVIPTQLIVRET